MSEFHGIRAQMGPTWAMKAIDLGMIQARRAKLDADIARLREEIAVLEARRSELDVAEHVFAELALEGDEANRQPIEGEVARDDRIGISNGTGNGQDHSGKPSGLPSMPEMIIEAIRHANSVGARGLDNAGLRAYIRGRYWAVAPARAVGPIAWRMLQRGQLNKRGVIYSLPR